MEDVIAYKERERLFGERVKDVDAEIDPFLLLDARLGAAFVGHFFDPLACLIVEVERFEDGMEGRECDEFDPKHGVWTCCKDLNGLLSDLSKVRSVLSD